MPDNPMVYPAKFSFDATSVEEAEAFFSGAYAPVKVSPGIRNRLAVHVEAVCAEGLTIFDTTCPTGVVFQTESSFDGYNLTVPLSGGFEVHGKDSGSVGQGAGGAMVVDARQVVRADFKPDLSFRGITVGSDALHLALADMIDGPVQKRIEFHPNLSQRDVAVRVALALADAIRDGTSADGPLLNAPSALANLRQAMLKLMLEALPHSYSARIDGTAAHSLAPRHLRRAIDFMNAHACEPITLSDIARAASTTPRSLQVAFQRFKGVTPTAYLRQLRLAGVRADLLDPLKPVSVSQIALRWGFFQLGAFSVRYREAFGELPSTTLGRRK